MILSAATSALSFESLTPTAFLDRAAVVWRNRVALIDSDRRLTYGEFHERSQLLAGALAELGVEAGDRVAVLAPNSELMLMAHYAVPYSGAVLVALNFRLSDGEIADILVHSGTTVLLVEERYADRAAGLSAMAPQLQIVLGGAGSRLERMLAVAEPLGRSVEDEMGLLAINYTSGTTGRPKGVMYHHRGAYLQALAMAYHTGLTTRSVMLWTLPMFHCNGWCFTWAATAAGATHLCLPAIEPARIWAHIYEDGVTHLNAAPTVLTMLADDPAAEGGAAPQTVRVCTGGAPPTPTLLARLRELNFEVTHLYGLTETFGPLVICEWQPAWDHSPNQPRLIARQGVGNVVSQQVRITDVEGKAVTSDGESLGEVRLRGNNVMLGYYRDEEATAEATPNGWFRTGDLGVIHPDGYLELKDRAKDIIISGGENIASVEVEQALASHSAVLECAVVAALDEKWGEVPIAFVTIGRGGTTTEAELLDYVKARIARYKAPRSIRFVEELPKTSTGKIQKHVLRRLANSGD